MEDGIEIYVRHSSERTLLTFHIPDGHKEKFLSLLARGGVIPADLPIHLEFSVLPEWLTDNDQKENLQEFGDYFNCRVPINSVVIH